MLGKIFGAALGRRMAGNRQGMRGAMIGAATPWMMRRAFTPLGLAVAGAYGAKKLYDSRKRRTGGVRRDY